MNVHKILFPTDFSTTANEALRMAVSLARENGAKLLIVHVEEPPLAYGGGDMYYGVPTPSIDQIKTMLAEIDPGAPDVEVERHLVTGEPADAIVRLAEEEKADLIVMSTHGRTGLTRLLMGSVAETVVRRAACPVLTVKHPAVEE